MLWFKRKKSKEELDAEQVERIRQKLARFDTESEKSQFDAGDITASTLMLEEHDGIVEWVPTKAISGILVEEYATDDDIPTDLTVPNEYIDWKDNG